MNNDLKELKPLGEPLNKANLNSNAPAEQNQAGALEKDSNKKDYSVLIFFVLSALFIGFVIYNMVSTKIYLKKVAEKRAAFQKAYAEQQKQIAAEGAAQKRLIPQAEDGFYVEPPVEEQKRVSSTELLMKAVEAEKGAIQTEEQKQQALDYGAQVAAYEAQVKAQQQAAQQKVQQPTLNRASQPQPTQRANTQQAAATQTQQEGGTKLNKLETRRIFK